MKDMKVLISGGGTGGHIFPALSIAAAIERRHPDAEILFVGAEGRMEMERVPAAGYRIVGLPVSGFDRKRLWRNFKVLFRLWKSIRRARKLVADFKPDIAVGVGGYASGPTLKAAQRAGVPTLLQEQNSYPGVTNKLLAPRAAAICVAYPGTERFFPAEKIVLTGNPVRPALLAYGASQAEAKAALGFDPSLPLVLVVGGSLGARTLNSAIISAIESSKVQKAPFMLMWQTGKADHERCQSTMEAFHARCRRDGARRRRRSFPLARDRAPCLRQGRPRRAGRQHRRHGFARQRRKDCGSNRQNCKWKLKIQHVFTSLA